MIESFIEDSEKYEAWLATIINTVTFEGNTLAEWDEALSLPDASSSMNPEEVEKFNNQLLNLTETVGKNTAYAKVAYLKAETHHKVAMLVARDDILSDLEGTMRKPPSADNMEKMCEYRCLSTLKVVESSKLIYEFWNTHSYKINKLHERLTSLNILKKNGY